MKWEYHFEKCVAEACRKINHPDGICAIYRQDNGSLCIEYLTKNGWLSDIKSTKQLFVFQSYREAKGKLIQQEGHKVKLIGK